MARLVGLEGANGEPSRKRSPEPPFAERYDDAPALGRCNELRPLPVPQAQGDKIRPASFLHLHLDNHICLVYYYYYV